MLLVKYAKAAVTADADPRASTPLAVTDARVATLEGYCDPRQKVPTVAISAFLRVLTAVPALAVGGQGDVTPYIYDEKSNLWVLAAAAQTAVPSDKLITFAIPRMFGPHRVFLQLTNIAGTSAATVDVYIGAAG